MEMKLFVGVLSTAYLTLGLFQGVCAQTDRSVRGQKKERPPGELEGKVEYYVSKVDGEKRPYVICATDDTDDPKPMVVVVHPGGTALEGARRLTGMYASMIKKNGESAMILRPTGRGPGSLYMNYGEVDLFEAIEDACKKYPIDRDCISIKGNSMGGAATWYLISHYPDFFSAGNPGCGYCDYRLWEKPGGYTFHMQEWEEPSWIARSAVFVPENFMYTPVWVIHGELDRSIGGGVPVEHSRRMTRLLADHGCPHKYTEIAGAGHSYQDKAPNITEESLLWLIKQRKERAPEHVKFATYTLRHSKSYWVIIEQFDRYGKRGMLDAEFIEPNELIVRTENIKTFALGPVQNRTSIKLNIEGQRLNEVDLSKKQMFRRSEEGVWKLGDFDLSREKRHGCSGPIADLFFDNTILVTGTTGGDAEKNYNRAVAGHQANLYRARNGGVHRGGIMGQNDVELPVVYDKDLPEEQLRRSNLILYGTFESNSVMRRFEGKLLVEFDGKVIRIGGRTYAGDQTTVFAVLPHPENPNRYVAVHGGVTPDAITYGSHIDLGLLPDYIVYSGGKVLDWGFWNNHWMAQ